MYMSPSTRWFLLCSVAAAATGCRSDTPLAPPASPFHLTVRGSTYAPGDVAEGALYNDGTANITGYSFCSGAIEQRVLFNGWFPVEGWAFPCVATMLTIAPGDSAIWSHQLPPDLPPGTYRLRFYGVPSYALEAGDGRSCTPPFTVVAIRPSQP